MPNTTPQTSEPGPSPETVPKPGAAATAPVMWVHEAVTSNNAVLHGVDRVIASEQTPFQSLLIADIGPYGRALFLDGKVQTTTGDEAYYHEPIVHLPALLHGCPRRVLILGGADGGAAREALRWRSVTHVVMVDIDARAVALCREHLSALHRGALDDRRVRVVIDDALSYIGAAAARGETYDVVVCDMTDPMENSPSLSVFNTSFFARVKALLSGPRATLSLQAGPTSLVENPVLFPRVCATVATAFAHVRPVQLFAPSYGCPLGLAVACDAPLALPSEEDVDRAFEDGLHGENCVLDGASFRAHFALPRATKDAIAREKRPYTPLDVPAAFGLGTIGRAADEDDASV